MLFLNTSACALSPASSVDYLENRPREGGWSADPLLGVLRDDTFEGVRKAGLGQRDTELLSVQRGHPLWAPGVTLELGCPSQLSPLETRRLALNNHLPWPWPGSPVG